MPDRVELKTTRIVTMRDLNQRTSAVMDEINEADRPVLVSRHGQFIALITPLAKHSIESVVLANDPELRGLLDEEIHDLREHRDTLTVDEVRAQLRRQVTDPNRSTDPPTRGDTAIPG